MIDKKNILTFLFFILILLSLNLIYASDQTDDSWIYNYINIDPSDDLYYGFKLKGYTPKKEYVENLKYNRDIKFYIDRVDEHNLKKNINALPRFPYVFMLYGGYSYNRALDIGFLARLDNIANLGLAYTVALSYGQKGYLWLHNNIEYNNLLDYRLKILGTLSFFTSAPQYSANLLCYPSVINYPPSSTGEQFGLYIVKFLNKVWNKLNITYYKQREVGFYTVFGIDYRVPVFELNIIPIVQINYTYEDKRDVTELGDHTVYNYTKTPEEKIVDRNNFGFNIGFDLKWDRLKATKTIPVGLYILFNNRFYLPTTIGVPNGEFRISNRLELKYTKKLFREFAARARFLGALNYNISDDFSGDPYVRGMADYELTGWFALLANLELFIPIVDVDMYNGLGAPFKRDAKFVVFWTLFADGGFTIDKYEYYLKDFYWRASRYQIRNSLERGNINGQQYIGAGNYLLPASTLGTGIHIHSYFLHFSLRADVAFNLIKAIVYYSPSNKPYGAQKNLTGPEFVEFVFAFSEMF